MINTALAEPMERDIWSSGPLTQEEFCIADEGCKWKSRECGRAGITLFFGSVTMFMSISGDCVVFLAPEGNHEPLVTHGRLKLVA